VTELSSNGQWLRTCAGAASRVNDQVQENALDDPDGAVAKPVVVRAQDGAASSLRRLHLCT
jgi:hypothetical protein